MSKKLIPTWEQLKKHGVVSYNPKRQEDTISILFFRVLMSKICEINPCYSILEDRIVDKCSLNMEEYSCAIYRPLNEEEEDDWLDADIEEFLKSISSK